jgi:hypothetical protein
LNEHQDSVLAKSQRRLDFEADEILSIVEAPKTDLVDRGKLVGAD